jgi:hypothetical protein
VRNIHQNVLAKFVCRLKSQAVRLRPRSLRGTPISGDREAFAQRECDPEPKKWRNGHFDVAIEGQRRLTAGPQEQDLAFSALLAGTLGATVVGSVAAAICCIRRRQRVLPHNAGADSSAIVVSRAGMEMHQRTVNYAVHELANPAHKISMAVQALMDQLSTANNQLQGESLTVLPDCLSPVPLLTPEAAVLSDDSARGSAQSVSNGVTKQYSNASSTAENAADIRASILSAMNFGLEIQRSVSQLNRIMADLRFTEGSLLAGKMEVITGNVRLTSLMRDVKHQLQSMFSVPVICIFKPEVPHRVISDSLRLRQLLVHGFANCIKKQLDGMEGSPARGKRPVLEISVQHEVKDTPAPTLLTRITAIDKSAANRYNVSSPNQARIYIGAASSESNTTEEVLTEPGVTTSSPAGNGRPDVATKTIVLHFSATMGSFSGTADQGESWGNKRRGLRSTSSLTASVTGATPPVKIQHSNASGGLHSLLDSTDQEPAGSAYAHAWMMSVSACESLAALLNGTFTVESIPGADTERTVCVSKIRVEAGVKLSKDDVATHTDATVVQLATRLDAIKESSAHSHIFDSDDTETQEMVLLSSAGGMDNGECNTTRYAQLCAVRPNMLLFNQCRLDTPA